MIPITSHPRYRALVTGQLSHPFKVTGASMLVSRCVRTVLAEGKSEKAIAQAIQELSVFFTKFEAIMADDIKAVFR